MWSSRTPFAHLMTSGRMSSTPGAFQVGNLSMDLLSTAATSNASRLSITDKRATVSSALSEVLLSLRYSSEYCSIFPSVCILDNHTGPRFQRLCPAFGWLSWSFHTSREYQQRWMIIVYSRTAWDNSHLHIVWLSSMHCLWMSSKLVMLSQKVGVCDPIVQRSSSQWPRWVYSHLLRTSPVSSSQKGSVQCCRWFHSEYHISTEQK